MQHSFGWFGKIVTVPAILIYQWYKETVQRWPPYDVSDAGRRDEQYDNCKAAASVIINCNALTSLSKVTGKQYPAVNLRSKTTV
jgi:hypothetical protein